MLEKNQVYNFNIFILMNSIIKFYVVIQLILNFSKHFFINIKICTKILNFTI